MDIKTLIQRTSFKQDFVMKERAFHATIVILCMQIQGEMHLVFQKRSANITRPGEIAFPGGKVEESDITLRKAAERETHEEMGIKYKDFSVYHKLFRINTQSLMVLDVFLGFTNLNSLSQMNPNPDEVESIFSIPLSYFLSHPVETYFVRSQYIVREEQNGELIDYFPYVHAIESIFQGKNIWENPKVPLFVYKTEYGIIWGLTAHILNRFIQILESDSNLLSI